MQYVLVVEMSRIIIWEKVGLGKRVFELCGCLARHPFKSSIEC